MALPHAICTVVIPCYNAEPYLEAAVASVRAQKFTDYHLVVVDDASTDNTLALAKQIAAGSSNITVIGLPENRGRSHARNRGCQSTTGPYVTFMDQDDTYHPDFILETVRALESVLMYDGIKVLPQIEVEIDQIRYEAIANSLATTVIFRRPAFEFIGGWPESQVYRDHPGGCEDITLLKLFSACFNVGILHAKFYNYTHRPGNALDLFLKRSNVVNGELLISGRSEIDRLLDQETERLQALLRDRIRQVLKEQPSGLVTLGGGHATM